MKKVLVLTIALTACKKDRVCECKITDTLPGSKERTGQFTVLHSTKRVAKLNCISSESDFYTPTGEKYTLKNECKLK